MRKNLYDNISLLAPDGEVLSHVPKQRADWYLRKELAEKIDDRTIKLLFEPAGRNKMPEWYYIEHKNICVVCGFSDANFLEKHHIVPICFRAHLPDNLKNHRSFDLALICHNCHDAYEVEASKFKALLISEAGLIPYERTDDYKTKQALLKAVKRLLRAKDGVPLELIGRCQATVLANLGRHIVSDEDVRDIKNQVSDGYNDFFRNVVKKHTPHEMLIIRWRKHFLEKSAPKFIDPSWIKDYESVY